MTKTTQQIEAIQFFEDNFDQVQNFGLSILADREERRLYNQGKELINKVCVVRRGRNLYTEDELIQLVDLYLKHDGHVVKVREDFMKINPETLHTAESIRACAGQLKSMDKTAPNDKKWAVKSLVQEVALNQAPDRFKAVI